MARFSDEHATGSADAGSSYELNSAEVLVAGREHGEQLNGAGLKCEQQQQGRRHKRRSRPARPPLRLTIPQCEFDYDRQQLLDPRLTPGRARPPRITHDDEDEYTSTLVLTELIRCHRRSRFPKGMSDGEKARFEAVHDPAHRDHPYEICLSKGRRGSPTYDAAGFELDFDKVKDWQDQREQGSHDVPVQQISKQRKIDHRLFVTFFDGPFDSQCPKKVDMARDIISKDLGVPWHKIGLLKLDLWQELHPDPKRCMLDMPFEEEDRRRMKRITFRAALRK